MAATSSRTRLGRVPVVPWVRCAAPRCDKVLAQRHEPWQGEPLWIQCRYCRQMNYIAADGVAIVAQAGDRPPAARPTTGE